MKSKALWAIRVCGWALIALIVLEVCARVEDRIRYGAPLLGNYSMDSLYQYDDLGKWGKPHSSYLQWQLNDVGYRGPDLRQNTYRIVCIGASETLGMYESHLHEWPRQLETILNQRAGGQRYEVVDVAYLGLSLGSTIKRLPQLESTLAPKMVVIYPSYTPYVDRIEPQSWPPPPPGAVRPQKRHFELRFAAKLQIMLKADLPERVQNWIREWSLKRSTKHVRVMDQFPQQNVDVFAQDLDTLVTHLQSSGVQVVLVTHATRFGQKLSTEDHYYLTQWRTFYPSLTESALLDMEARMGNAVRQEGARRNVPVVDAAREIPPGREDFAEFVHFTDKGSQRMATLVADEIEALQKNPAQPAAPTAAQPATK